jgi:hypothetical protein
MSMKAKAFEEELSRPFDRCYWVEHGVLLAGCYPGQQDEEEARTQFARMIDFGVTHFVNLMHSSEKDHAGRLFRPYEGIAREIAAERGIKVTCVRFPIRDMGVSSVEEMIRILDSIDAKAQAGQITYLHCWGGMGRTGTVVGCWLARHGKASGQVALDRITELRRPIPDRLRGDSPQTDRQRDMVRKWREKQ